MFSLSEDCPLALLLSHFYKKVNYITKCAHRLDIGEEATKTGPWKGVAYKSSGIDRQTLYFNRSAGILGLARD